MIIVDASVAVQWIAEEDTSALSDELLSRDDLTAPELLQIEVANALRRKVWVGDMGLDRDFIDRARESGLQKFVVTLPLEVAP